MEAEMKSLRKMNFLHLMIGDENMRTKRIFLLLMSMILLTSCNNKDLNNDSENTGENRFIDYNYNFYQNGRVHLGVNENGSNVALYTDFETLGSVPLCAKPNCSHNNNECAAKLINSNPIIHNEKIYFLSYVDGVKELSNGKREYYINSKLNSLSMATSESATICEFNDCAPYTDEGMYLYGNEIFFMATDMGPYENEYGDIVTSDIGGKQFLCSINLDSGEYHNYGTIYPKDEAYESADSSRHGFIVGCKDLKLNIFYSYIPEHKSNSYKDFVLMNIEFDLENKTFTESSLPSPSYLDENSYVGYDNQNEKNYIYYKDNTYEVDAEDRYDVSLINGKYFDSNSDVWLDLETNTEYSMGKYKGYIAVTMYENSYILIKGQRTVKLTEDELFALDKE